MSTPKKKAVVSKRVSDEEKLNSLRWEFFLSQCAIPWESLSEEVKDFFECMGSTESSAEDINNAVDAAMKNGEKK